MEHAGAESMIAIINRSTDSRPASTLHEYTVQINSQPVVARFSHRRTEPLSVCLRRAADAVELEEARGTTENPFKETSN